MTVINDLPPFSSVLNRPQFSAPWEAEVFAIAVSLEKRGIFTWPEWAKVLGDEIKKSQRAGDPDDGSTYYRHWTSALERILLERRIASPTLLSHYHIAWKLAADRTPHGLPIELRPEDHIEVN